MALWQCGLFVPIHPLSWRESHIRIFPFPCQCKYLFQTWKSRPIGVECAFSRTNYSLAYAIADNAIIEREGGKIDQFSMLMQREMTLACVVLCSERAHSDSHFARRLCGRMKAGKPNVPKTEATEKKHILFSLSHFHTFWPSAFFGCREFSVTLQ